MKRLFAIVVAVALVTFGAQVMASPPVGPPKEGFLITTNTDIECFGTVEEKEAYNWTYYQRADTDPDGDGPNGGNPLRPRTGGAFNRGAEVAYQEDFKAIDGITRFVKDFSADSHSEPNLQVAKVIGYLADPESPAAQATFTEKVGLSVVAAGDGGLNFSGLLSLCPWVTTSSYPATNEGIAAGSSFKVTAIQNFNTQSEVVSTDIPNLTYTVDLRGQHGLQRYYYPPDPEPHDLHRDGFCQGDLELHQDHGVPEPVPGTRACQPLPAGAVSRPEPEILCY